MTRSVVRRFTTMDDAGNRYVIIEYRTFEESDEIRTDRMSADPITGQLFETLQGRAVEQIDEKSGRRSRPPVRTASPRHQDMACIRAAILMVAKLE